MSFKLMTEGSEDIVSPVTTPIIAYDETSSGTSSSKDDISYTRAPKRGNSLPQIFFASTLIAFTTPIISLPDLPLSRPTYQRIFDQTVAIERSRRITLREARTIALQAHYLFEEGLRNDRIQEARLMELAFNENEV